MAVVSTVAELDAKRDAIRDRIAHLERLRDRIGSLRQQRIKEDRNEVDTPVVADESVLLAEVDRVIDAVGEVKEK